MEQQIEVPGEWHGLEVLLEFTVQYAEEQQLSSEQSYYLRLVAEEIATNIVKYGYPEDVSGVIQMCCSYSTNEQILKIAIRDQGRPYDPRDCPPPDLHADVNERTVGGLGLYLVREFADDLTYHHDGVTGWNELIILKYATRD